MAAAEWANIAVRFALYADLTLLFGVAAFGLYALNGDERRSGAVIRSRLWLPLLAGLGVLLSGIGLSVTISSLAELPLGQIDPATAQIILDDTALGTAWKVRIAALLLAVAAGLLVRSASAALWLVAVASAAALSSLAWGGHAAAGEGRTLLIGLASDIIHLLAAGIWVGALAVLLGMTFAPDDRASNQQRRLAHRSLRSFSKVGTIIVLVLIMTGLVNGWSTVGPAQIGVLPETPYGQLLLIKLGLFGVMLALASLNRFRLTPALGRDLTNGDPPSLAQLRMSLAVETSLVLVILALVAWFGTLEPPGHVG